MTSKVGLSPLTNNVTLTQHQLRRRLSIQLTVFIFLELAFIALAGVCLRTPLPCSFSSSLTLPKAIFTVVFIIWQTIAIMCAQGVVSHGFSSEWYIRFSKTGKLIPGDTDIVSTATARYLDRFRYFFGRDCSLSYRLSFITSLILIALAGLAPGSINVEDVQRFEPSTVLITNFTAVGGDIDGILKNPIFRTSLIAELELRENTTFQFRAEEHIIAGWPNIESGQLTGDIKFQSDVLVYDFTCRWEAPSFNISRWNTTWYAGGYAWYPWTTPLPKTSFEGGTFSLHLNRCYPHSRWVLGLMPMYRFTTHQEFLPDDFPDPLHADGPVGLQGYVFFGRNSSLPKSKSKTKTLNLDGLPTTFNSSGYLFLDYDGADGHFKTPLATFLLCDPHARTLDGEVLLSQRNASVTLLSASSPVNGRTRVGNISPDAANVALGLSMMEVLEVDDEEATMRIGILASQAFTNDTSQNFDRTRANPFDIGILPLEDIQRNLNFYMNSGGKSVSSYVKNYDIEGTDQLFLMPVQGAIEQDEQALVTSQGLMIATITLFFCATVLSFINLFYLRVWKTPAFKLDTLVHQIQKENDEKYVINVSVPSACSDVMRSRPTSPSTSTLEDIPYSNRPTLRKLLTRLLGFILLELAFLLLVLFCTRKPILVDIPLSLAEVKGGFTVIFILWHTLAIFLPSDALSFAFSSEWSLQHAKTGRLVPGTTDRVSRLTSGNDDRTRYFLTSYASMTFRCAFLAFLVSAALNSFAPGSLAVSKIIVTISIPMNVADIRMVNSSQSDDNENQMDFLQDRANSLVELERHEGSVFKYSMEPNWLMAWPDENTIDPSVVGNVVYPTDVVHFNYSCEWRVPEMGSDDGATTWNVDGHKWEIYGDVVSDFPYVGGKLATYDYAIIIN